MFFLQGMFNILYLLINVIILRKKIQLSLIQLCLFCHCRTWSGPAWSPAQSLSSVLISIQSLLNEKPYHNEPGFEQVSWHGVL